jgi:hypothetical protein
MLDISLIFGEVVKEGNNSEFFSGETGESFIFSSSCGGLLGEAVLRLGDRRSGVLLSVAGT